VLALRYDDISMIMGDRRFSRDLSAPDAPRLFPSMLILDDPTLLMNMHGADHLRLRRLIGPAFTPRRSEQWRPLIRAAVEKLLDEVERSGAPVDLMATFAYQLPIHITCVQLGIPQADVERVKHWISAFLSVSAMSLAERDTAAVEFTAYTAELIAQHRAEAGDDLIDHLINARDADDRLSEDELVSMVRGLIIGGNETIANGFSRAVFSLLQHPDSWDELVADRSLVPAAVEELLRFNPPGGGASGLLRLATEDIDVPSGGTIRAGQAVLTPLIAAGHDPAVFPDPERIDFHRPKHDTMQFGAGQHFCPGTHIGRVELQEALDALLARFPKLRLTVPPEELPWSQGGYGSGLVALTVTW
jgi:cytochrome P450